MLSKRFLGFRTRQFQFVNDQVDVFFANSDTGQFRLLSLALGFIAMAFVVDRCQGLDRRERETRNDSREKEKEKGLHCRSSPIRSLLHRHDRSLDRVLSPLWHLPSFATDWSLAVRHHPTRSRRARAPWPSVSHSQTFEYLEVQLQVCVCVGISTGSEGMFEYKEREREKQRKRCSIIRRKKIAIRECRRNGSIGSRVDRVARRSYIHR